MPKFIQKNYMITIPKEVYIKAIYEITEITGKKVSTSAVAEKLKVSNAAASEMARKLFAEKVIDYEKYRGMSLTSKGRKIAINIVRRHRLWELFLIKALDLSWSEVHEEAERFENHTSDFLIQKIDDYLGNPEYDPHGHPIPNINGEFPKQQKSIGLLQTESGKKYKVVSVDDKNREIVTFFSDLGLILDAEIKIIEKYSFDNSTLIDINGKQHSLSEKIGSLISVVSC